MVFKYFYLWSVMWCVKLAVAQDGVAQMKMAVGTAQMLNFNSDESLSLSKKGIVDVVYKENGNWLITALHQGLVVLKVEDSQGSERKRVIIEVTAEKKEKEQLSALQSLCNKNQLICDLDIGVIRGFTDSFVVFLNAKKLCRTAQKCLFDLRLSDAGKQQLNAYLIKKLGPDVAVQINDQGLILVYGSCLDPKQKEQMKTTIDYLSGGMVTYELFLLKCFNEAVNASYIASAKIIAFEESHSKEFGANQHFRYQLLKDHKYILTHYQDLSSALKDHKAKVIAEPVARLNPYSEVILFSGGEFKVMYDTGSKDRPYKEAWKKTGVELKIRIIPISKDQVRLESKLNLKHRSTVQQEGLIQVGQLVTETDIALEKPFIIGEIDVEGLGQVTEGMYIFSSLPIIGPFFQLMNHQTSKSKLVLAMQVLNDSLDGFQMKNQKWPKSPD